MRKFSDLIDHIKWNGTYHPKPVHIIDNKVSEEERLAMEKELGCAIFYRDFVGLLSKKGGDILDE